MMYCTPQSVREMLKTDILSAIVGDEYIGNTAAREQQILSLITRATEDACAEVDGYLSRRYQVPLTVVPKVIEKYAKDITIYNLVSRMGIGKDEREDNYRERYKFAIKFLTMVAEGKVGFGRDDPKKEAASGFQMSGPNRLFDRESMEGM